VELASKVRAMMRVATPDNKALLLDYARLMTASSLEKLCRKYALVQRHEAPHPVSDEQHRYVRRRDTEDGMIKIEAVLHPEEAELVWTMLNHAATQLAHEPHAGSHDDSAESRAVLSASAITTAGHIASCSIDDSAESQVALSVPGTTAISLPGHIESHRVGDSAESQKVIESTSHRDVLAPGWHGAPSPPSIDGDRATSRGPSALRQRADAAKRAFNRADALVSLAQGYLRGDRPHRSPIEITLTVAGSSLRAEARLSLRLLAAPR
jgi:hypothetical protein